MYSEFKYKEVINVRDCRRLGRVTDFEFDECKGIICKLIVSDRLHFFGFCRGEADTVIPWKSICQIGPDIILVDINC